MYQLRLAYMAQGDLDRLSSAAWQRMQGKLTDLREIPKPRGYARLQGGAYRILVGDYKILYDLDDNQKLITVLRVKHT